MTPDREALRRAAEKLECLQKRIGDFLSTARAAGDPLPCINIERLQRWAESVDEAIDAEKTERDALQARAEKAEALVALYRETAALEAKACDEADAILAQAVKVVKPFADAVERFEEGIDYSISLGDGTILVRHEDFDRANTFLATLQPEERQ